MSHLCTIKWILVTFCLLYLIAVLGSVDARKSRFKFRKPTKIRNPTKTLTKGVGGKGVGKSSWFKKALFAGAAGGILYGLVSYKTRRRFRDYPDREPRICRNFYSPNGTHYGYFICPQWDQPENYEYCCGPESRQYCCGFWDDSGRVAGVVIGIIVSVAVVGLCVYCCCKKARAKQGHVVQTDGAQPKATAATYNAASGTVDTSAQPYPAPPNPDPAPPYGAQPAYPAAPNQPYPAAYPPQPAYPAQPSYPPQPVPYPNVSYGPPDAAPPYGGGYPPAGGMPYPPGGAAPPYPTSNA